MGRSISHNAESRIFPLCGCFAPGIFTGIKVASPAVPWGLKGPYSDETTSGIEHSNSTLLWLKGMIHPFEPIRLSERIKPATLPRSRRRFNR